MFCYKAKKDPNNPYQPDSTYNVLRDLEKGKVIFGTMFREIFYLEKIINQGLNPVQEAYECGYRFIVIDCEHKAFNRESLAKLSQEAHKVGISIWIRPEQVSDPPLSLYADLGYSGFMIPNVNYPEEVKHVVDRVYFPPIASPTRENDRGRRGFSLGEIQRDGQIFRNILDGERYVNRNTLVAIQTEHPIGISNLSDILAIPGVFGTIIGVNDLARGLAQKESNEFIISLDFSSLYRHDLMIKAYEEVSEKCHEVNKYAGVHFTEINEADLIKKLIDNLNFKLIMLGRDENYNDPKYVEMIQQYTCK
jgi:2-keto-3-deoxy-L-rhamnonate aldolase RhmA